MARHSDKSQRPGPERPFAGRALQGMLIVAIVALIVIAVISFN